MDENGNKTTALPQVATYRNFEEFRALADRSLDNREKMIYYVGAVENLAAVFDEEYEREFYIPTRLKRGIGLKLLIPDSPVLEAYQAQDAQENRETRALKADMQMDASFMIHDDTVVFFGETEEGYALELRAPSLARTLKTMFDDAWNNTN